MPAKTPPLVLAALLSVLAGACGDSTPENTAEPATTPEIIQAEAEPAAVAMTVRRSPEQTYRLYCEACHAAGEGHPGTMMLGLKKGPEQAVIKGNAALPKAYIKQVVRGGLLEMSPFRPTEISDAELDALADYLRQPERAESPAR